MFVSTEKLLKNIEIEKAESVTIAVDGQHWQWRELREMVLTAGVQEDKIVEVWTCATRSVESCASPAFMSLGLHTPHFLTAPPVSRLTSCGTAMRIITPYSEVELEHGSVLPLRIQAQPYED